jgi:glycosyltransferase involved in cell wall biosynthesis
MFERSGLPPEKICVKPNFVYPDPGCNSAEVGEHALFVGRLSPEKRVGTVLSAWARLRNAIPLLVIGGGPERQHLETQAKTLGVSNITFRGQQPREHILGALRLARFLVFPSEWYENFPVTLAESFACGVPVICSRLGAMQEIVDDGYTGLHFSPGDAEDLAKKVEWAWNHPEEMKNMGNQARLEFEKKYTAEKNYVQLMEIYDSAIADMRNARKRQG